MSEIYAEERLGVCLAGSQSNHLDTRRSSIGGKGLRGMICRGPYSAPHFEFDDAGAWLSREAVRVTKRLRQGT